MQFQHYKNWMRSWRLAVLAGVPLLAVAAGAATIPQGTSVTLVFDQAINSKHIKTGQTVQLHVKNDLDVDGQTVLKASEPVTGVVTAVNKRQRYGVNARVRLALNPVTGTDGEKITLEPRQKGQVVGARTGGAAAATIGGAAVLGPIGLIGGYFVSGKTVQIHRGDELTTEVASPTATASASSKR